MTPPSVPHAVGFGMLAGLIIFGWITFCVDVIDERCGHTVGTIVTMSPFLLVALWLIFGWA